MGLLAWAAVTSIGVDAALSVFQFLAPTQNSPTPATFSAAGLVAGTTAAGAQSYVGSVPAGLFFQDGQAIPMPAPTPTYGNGVGKKTK